MTDFRDLQIHVVYSAKETPRVAAPGAAPGLSLRLRAVALLTLVVGVAWLYATWFHAWPWAENEFMQGELLLVMAGSNAHHAPPATTQPQEGDKPAEKTPAPAPTKAQRTAATQQAQFRLGQITYGWLALTSVIGLWMIMSGSAALLRSRGLALL
ncbi:MAG TPA: hypothetical protein P5572_09410, partial [Phycisphaerae bacterium]|nr:hypothetical protein [Phycisphaerae bacterium]